MIEWALYWAKHWVYQAVVSVIAVMLYPSIVQNIDWMMAVLNCKDCTLPTNDEYVWAYFGMPITEVRICPRHIGNKNGNSGGGVGAVTGMAVGVAVGSSMGHHN